MSEVHRYQVVTMLSMAGATIGYDPHGPEVVMASDFDNATRLFLDAAERCIASERREKELQQRLTAADERVDVLEGLLRSVIESGALTLAIPSGEEIEADICAALKPAEGGVDDGETGSTCNQIREEAGLKPNSPCKACGHGACIDR